MTAILLVIVAAMLLGISPGLALIVVALAYLCLDAYAPEGLDSLTQTMRR